MKSNYWLLTVIFALVALPGKAGEWIRINQLGYLPQSVKVAVFMSEEGTNVENYSLIDASPERWCVPSTQPRPPARWEA